MTRSVQEMESSVSVKFTMYKILCALYTRTFVVNMIIVTKCDVRLYK